VIEMPAQYHRRHINDRLKPIGGELKEKNALGVLVPSILTDKTVAFRMVDESGEIVVNDRAATVTNAATGLVQYDFLSTEVDTVGTYYGYFVVTDTATGKTNTYPVVKGDLVIEIYGN